MQFPPEFFDKLPDRTLDVGDQRVPQVRHIR